MYQSNQTFRSAQSSEGSRKKYYTRQNELNTPKRQLKKDIVNYVRSNPYTVYSSQKISKQSSNMKQSIKMKQSQTLKFNRTYSSKVEFDSQQLINVKYKQVKQIKGNNRQTKQIKQTNNIHSSNQIHHKDNINKLIISSDDQFSKFKQKSLNINVKSNTKQLISSKQYANRIIGIDWDPIFPDFNQEMSIPLENDSPIRISNHQYSKFPALTTGKGKPDNYKDRDNYLENDQFIDQPINEPFARITTSDQLFNNHLQISHQTLAQIPQTDMQKLSIAYTQLKLKNDTKHIKKLNTKNQQLKSICKEMIALLRNDSKRKIVDQLVVKEIYKIVTGYDERNMKRIGQKEV